MNSCIKCVGAIRCRRCNGVSIKHGKIRGRQRYRCKACKITFLHMYRYKHGRHIAAKT
ncbi:IS1/IS1595 family N-terminal zinc-binding domain-containing protein [Mucilaginibacter terrae]|uniref:IS1/IS1595 family N-terminal zinc-binding domain-containing protein n=1 Tax=Mucilaginibacter terrae TaxID=1955052 RepID=UPI00406B94AA